MDGEMTFTLAVAQSQYAGVAACYSAMLDTHCGVECHASQDVFTVGSDVQICDSYCTSLHGLCASADDVSAVTEACVDANSVVDCSGFTPGDSATCTRINSACAYTAPVTLVDASGMAAATWCAGLTIFPWVSANGGTYTTSVVADAGNVGTCWGGPAGDGCDGVPNSGTVVDACGVCGGTAVAGDGTCTVSGASTVAQLNTDLTTNLAAHVAAETAAQGALSTWATTQAARLVTEQTRASLSHSTKLAATEAARVTLTTSMADKDTAITGHTLAVANSLTAARTASTNDMAALASKVSTSQAAINTDYTRVQTAHAAQTAVSEAVLAREMANWQTTHTAVEAEISRLKAA